MITVLAVKRVNAHKAFVAKIMFFYVLYVPFEFILCFTFVMLVFFRHKIKRQDKRAYDDGKSDNRQARVF
jgi:hypothetical protein